MELTLQAIKSVIRGIEKHISAVDLSGIESRLTTLETEVLGASTLVDEINGEVI